MFDLTDRTALVTGATGGIGAAIARIMHAKGAVVAISGRRGDPLDGLAGVRLRSVPRRTIMVPDQAESAYGPYFC